MSDLRLDAALDKCSPPLTRMCWIGVVFDSVQMTMEIEEWRVGETLEWCDKMLAVQVPSTPGRVPGEWAMRLDGFTDYVRPDAPTLSQSGLLSTLRPQGRCRLHRLSQRDTLGE